MFTKLEKQYIYLITKARIKVHESQMLSGYCANIKLREAYIDDMNIMQDIIKKLEHLMPREEE